MTTRVAVIDDDDITRIGTVTVLGRHPLIEVVRTGPHDREWPSWGGVDVALVDASDHRRTDDQFPGVGVVRRIKAEQGATCTVIVVTGVLFDDVVRRRMREAGADCYYQRGELTDAATLVRIVLARGDRRPVPEPADPEALFRLGVTRHSRVNEGIEAAQRLGLTSGDVRIGHRGRDRTQRRAAFNDRARLTPVTTGGRPPDRPQDAPSLPQIDRFLHWATTVRHA